MVIVDMERPRILIAYATKYGSTAEIAETIADALQKKRFEVDCVPVTEAIALDDYDGVVIGSPIYMGRLLREAVEFVRKHQHVLLTRPCAAFAVCYFLRARTEAHLQIADKTFDSVRRFIPLSEVGLFAGRVMPERMSFIDRSISTLGGLEPGDWREWDEIRAWANDFASLWD